MVDGCILLLKMSLDCGPVLRRCNYHHPHAHIECSIHLRFGNVSYLLHQLENWKHRPTAFINLYRGTLRQNPRDIVCQAAPSDMRETLYQAGIKQPVEHFEITDVRL